METAKLGRHASYVVSVVERRDVPAEVARPVFDTPRSRPEQPDTALADDERRPSSGVNLGTGAIRRIGSVKARRNRVRTPRAQPLEDGQLD